MKKLLEFLNSYGTLILVLLGLTIFLNTCGMKNMEERNFRKLNQLEKNVQNIDSIMDLKISSEKMDILLKINAIEIAREVVYSENSVVRQITRPDDLINKYNNQIKELQEKLKNVK